MAKIKEIGHAVLHVRNLERSRAFYRDVLGMQEVTTAPGIPGCFLSFGDRDHDIALFETGEPIAPQGVNHIAFELAGDLDALKAFHRELVKSNVSIRGTVDHGISYGIYFLDPDGHQLEVFLERERPEPTRVEALRAVGVMSKPVDVQSLHGEE